MICKLLSKDLLCLVNFATTICFLWIRPSVTVCSWLVAHQETSILIVGFERKMPTAINLELYNTISKCCSIIAHVVRKLVTRVSPLLCDVLWPVIAFKAQLILTTNYSWDCSHPLHLHFGRGFRVYPGVVHILEIIHLDINLIRWLAITANHAAVLVYSSTVTLTHPLR